MFWSLFSMLPLATLVSLTALDGIYLPGTQPGELGAELQQPFYCRICHGDFDYAKEPYFQWQSGMMSQAARNPVSRAAITIAEQDATGAAGFCWRCHAPHAWLGGRTDEADGSHFISEDLEGVTCDLCHRMVDPLSDEGKALVEPDVPYYGNSMYVISPEPAKRGPRDDPQTNHEWIYSEFHKKGQFCGVCHDISNPLRAQDPVTQAPYEYGPSTRTFSEWELSRYARMGERGNCQSCHMPKGVGKNCRFEDAPERSDMSIHSQTGANYWVPRILPAFWDYDPVQLDALWIGRQHSIDLLRKSARLQLMDVETDSGGNPTALTIRVINETGHKFPTGNLIRRAWLNVQFLDAQGRLLGESGGYNFNTGQLRRDAQARVYEFLRETENGEPTLHHMQARRVVKDSRIPPRGFKNAAFARRKMEPVGVQYADGQYWDDARYQVPAGTKRIRATLYYQVMTKEYVEMLRDDNHTNDRGQRVYNAWLATDRCPPVPVTTMLYPSDTKKPSAPTSLRAEGISYTRIRLTWTPARDNDRVVYYEVWRKEVGSTGYRKVGTTQLGETEFTDAALQPGQSYTYCVKAVDTARNISPPSQEVVGRTDE